MARDRVRVNKTRKLEKSLEKKRLGMIARYIACGIAIGIVLNNVSTPPGKFYESEVGNSERSNGFPSLSKEVHADIAEASPLSDVWSCSWFPNDHLKCIELLYNRLPSAATNKERMIGGGNVQHQINSQRWLFFGDSTMKRLFDLSELKKVLIEDPLKEVGRKCLGDAKCEEHAADRCDLNINFGLPFAEQWVPPDPNSFEGPKKYGVEHPYCTDCSGCQTHFMECSYLFDPRGGSGSVCKNNKRRYGGYITMEFARDKEIQTPQFSTTQENVGHYISTIWNTPDLLGEWGKPICVLGTGNHDILLDAITTKDFIQNVFFMLKTMQQSCSHMVWLGNTCNGRESEYPQTMKQMKVWDRAVMELIESNPDLLNMMTYLDVLDASLTFPHADFIHMDDHWYNELGKFFISFM